MRVKAAKYQVILAAMRAIIEHVGKERIWQSYLRESDERMVWDCWHKIHYDLLYADTHPAYQPPHNRTRVLPQNTNFDMYSDGDNDRHIGTALMKAARELGLLPRPEPKLADTSQDNEPEIQ
jgi:hypothetical protein